MGDENLDGGFVLRRVESVDDVRRCVEFNTRYNNKMEGATYDCLHRFHPGLRWDESLYIESVAGMNGGASVTGNNGNASVTGNNGNAHARSGEVAATVCLIPWEMDFDGVRLKTAQLEMVLAHPEYRKRGLAERLIKRFMEGLAPAGYDVSIIWGIPYYYRKYSYTYCMYGNEYVTLPAADIPGADENTAGSGAPGNHFALRKAAGSDAPALANFYNNSVRCNGIYLKRDAEYWRYLIRDARHPVYMIDAIDCNNGRGNRTAGYIIYDQPSDKEIRIIECGVGNYADGLPVLQLLKKMCGGIIRIGGEMDGALARLARSYGAVLEQKEQWLVRITDIPAFMMKIAPALEKRLASSGCAGITSTLVINTYKKAYRLVISEGRLVSCGDIGFRDYSMGADGGDLCIPADALTRLIFGFRQLDQLIDAWPDIAVKKSARLLIDVLFPGVPAYINTPYHYLA